MTSHESNPVKIHCARCGTYLIPRGVTASGLDQYTCETCCRGFVVAGGMVCPTFDNGATYKPGFGVALSLLEGRENEVCD